MWTEARSPCACGVPACAQSASAPSGMALLFSIWRRLAHCPRRPASCSKAQQDTVDSGIAARCRRAALGCSTGSKGSAKATPKLAKCHTNVSNVQSQPQTWSQRAEPRAELDIRGDLKLLQHAPVASVAHTELSPARGSRREHSPRIVFNTVVAVPPVH